MKMTSQKSIQRMLNTIVSNKLTIATAFLGIACLVFACRKQDEAAGTTAVSEKNQASVSSQPLPGGKANFSAVVGNLDISGNTVVRIGNYTFTSSTGTVAYTYWHWDNTLFLGKTYLSNHTCTMDGITKTANIYTPTNWILPSGQYNNRSGSYTYNTSTGLLSITWNSPWAGVTESWYVSNPDTKTAYMSLNSNNYGLTHGRGYGSNASWSTYKTVTSVPRIDYPGYRVTVSSNGSTISVTPTTAGAWYPDALNLSSYTSATGGNTLHTKLAASSGVCTSGCSPDNTHTGIVYHLGGPGTSRSMVYNHWCACLPLQSSFPVYTGNMHPYAMQQIIDDDGNLRGFVGIEEQNQSGYTGYQFQLKVYFQ